MNLGRFDFIIEGETKRAPANTLLLFLRGVSELFGCSGTWCYYYYMLLLLLLLIYHYLICIIISIIIIIIVSISIIIISISISIILLLLVVVLVLLVFQDVGFQNTSRNPSHISPRGFRMWGFKILVGASGCGVSKY